MKRLFVAGVLGMVRVSALAQGTVNFANAWIGYTAPDYLSDGITKLEGPQFTAQLMAGPNASSLVAIATVPFSTGRTAGYFFGGSQTINTVPCGGIAFIQLNIWNTNTGTTFAGAQASGLANAWAQSSVFPIVTSGGACCDPPCLPNMLVGLPSLILNGPTISPLLTLSLSPTNTLLFSWVSPPGAFVMEENSNLNSTNWKILTDTPSAIGFYNQMMLAPAGGGMFYRLVSEQTQFSYTSTNGGITITSYVGPGGAVTIPNTINGLPVTNIGPYAFYASSSLTAITIPDSVMQISDSAFQFCSSLTNLIIGKGVKGIGSSAFYACGGLKSVTIPDGVTSIGAWAFSGCSGLTNSSIGDSVTIIGYEAFSACANLATVTVGKSVTYIGDSAFDSCSGLTNVRIGNNVSYIGNYAFHDCTSLSSLVIPGSVTVIGSDAFSGCADLITVTIPSGVTSIGAQAFSYCSSLVGLAVDPLNSDYSSIDGVLFDKSHSMLIQYPAGRTNSVYVVPNGVSAIEGLAFVPSPYLTSVAIADTVTEIGDSAFYSCTSLTNVTFGRNLTTIGFYAFTYCSSLPTIILPDSLITIETSAFFGCGSLTNIIIGAGVADIEDYAFGFCPNLSGLYFKGNAPAIGLSVFSANSTIYYLPGNSGWGTTFGGVPTAVWVLPYPVILNNSVGFLVESNRFAFTVSWATNLAVIVEASTNLLKPFWQPLQTNTLISGSFDFTDPQWTNYSVRFYRTRSQ